MIFKSIFNYCGEKSGKILNLITGIAMHEGVEFSEDDLKQIYEGLIQTSMNDGKDFNSFIRNISEENLKNFLTDMFSESGIYGFAENGRDMKIKEMNEDEILFMSFYSELAK